jgi:hypothetical protein
MPTQDTVIPPRREAANPGSRNIGLWNLDSEFGLRSPRNDISVSCDRP